MRSMIGSVTIVWALVAAMMLGGCSSTPENSSASPDAAENPAASESTDDEPSPIKALLTAIMGDSPAERRQKLLDKLSSPDADLRREGVYMLAEKEPAQWNVTPKLLKVMARGDADPQVRAAAVQVLAEVASDEAQLAEVLPFITQDSSPLARRAGVAAMAARPQPAYRDELLAMLEAETDPEIRARVAAALGEYEDRKVLLALLDALADDHFSVSYRARESLTQITGVDYGYDQDAWREHVIAKYLER